MATDLALNLTDKIHQYETTRRRGVEFILANIGPDGAPNDVGRPRVTYYRLPWSLAVSGETAAASRVLTWIERNAINPGGPFDGNVRWAPEANRAVNTYAETCLAYGATLLRRFDLARAAMRFAVSHQDPLSGGVYMNRERSDEDPQLLFLTAQLGMSAVMTGELEIAIGAGSWLCRLWEAQPELPNRLYTIWTNDGGLATTVPPDADARHYVNDAREVRQYHYNGGIAAACLVHLYLATGRYQWLETARAYQQFSMDTTEAQFDTKQVCKSAWGAGLLYLASGDERYLPWLGKMGDWFAAGQEADGGWSNTPYLDPDPPLAHRLEATAEFVVHLDTVIGALATAVAGGPR